MTSRWWRTWRRTSGRPGTLRRGDVPCLLEAGAGLAVARAAILVVPFRRIARILGEPGVETPRDPLPREEEEAALRVGWAVRAVAARTPWDSRCLAQALAAMAMLRRRRLDGTLYLGVTTVSPAGERKLEAHAWVRSGPHLLTGEPGHERFTVVTSFARRPAISPAAEPAAGSARRLAGAGAGRAEATSSSSEERSTRLPT